MKITDPRSCSERFRRRIEAFSRVRRGLLNAALGYSLGGVAVGTGLFALLFLGGWLPNAFVNLALFVLVFAVLAALLVLYLRRRMVFRSHMSEAFLMESLAGGLDSRLVSALDFSERERPTPLMQVVIDRACKDVELDIEGRLDRSRVRELRRRFVCLFILFVALGLTPWFGFGRLVRNLRSSVFAVRERLFPVVYEVVPPCGRHVYQVGKDVSVAIKFRTRYYDEVSLIERVGDETRRHTLRVDESGRASYVVNGDVESERRVQFHFGERTSGEIVLIFADLPILENMQTELIYPAYTRMLPRSLEGVQDHLYCLARTTITLGFTFSKDLKTAELVWDDRKAPEALKVVGRFASTSFTMPNRPRTATLRVEDIHGFGLKYPFTISFELQADEKPQVFLPNTLKPEMPTLAEGLKLFGFGVRVQDDFGVRRCVLKWAKSTVSNPSQVTGKGEIERLISPPQRKAIVSFEKAFENFDARPGDRISFTVEVYDNCPEPPGGQKAVSPARALFVYQQELEGLRIADLGFGSGARAGARIGKSKRATTVKPPMATFTQEKVWNEYEAKLDSTARPPRLPSAYAEPVREYFRLISTAVDKDKKQEKQ